MGISGQPGPQTVDSIRLDMYFTLMEQAVHGLNCIPYLTVGNYGLLTPQHLINPWANSKVRVRELPVSSVRELRELRGTLVTQMAALNSQMKEEITLDIERWKQRRLKLGKNKSEESVAPGDLMMLRRDNKNE